MKFEYPHDYLQHIAKTNLWNIFQATKPKGLDEFFRKYGQAQDKSKWSQTIIPEQICFNLVLTNIRLRDCLIFVTYKSQKPENFLNQSICLIEDLMHVLSIDEKKYEFRARKISAHGGYGNCLPEDQDNPEDRILSIHQHGRFGALIQSTWDLFIYLEEYLKIVLPSNSKAESICNRVCFQLEELQKIMVSEAHAEYPAIGLTFLLPLYMRRSTRKYVFLEGSFLEIPRE